MLRPEEDAFGHEIYDYYQGKSIVEIIERSDGLIGLSTGPASYFAEYEDWTTLQQQAINLARGRCVDIGCGPGRICLYLQEQGLEVVGIDNSPLAIKTAQLRGVRNARALSITRASRNTLGLFDTILMFGGNFGLFGDAVRAKWLLRRLRRMTTADGRIIAETRDIYDTDDPEHLAYQAQNRAQGRMSGQLRLRVRYKQMKGPWFDYLMVSPAELEAIVAGTGWRVEKLLREEGNASYVAVLGKGNEE